MYVLGLGYSLTSGVGMVMKPRLSYFGRFSIYQSGGAQLFTYECINETGIDFCMAIGMNSCKCCLPKTTPLSGLDHTYPWMRYSHSRAFSQAGKMD